MNRKAFGQVLRNLRKQQGFSQVALGAAASVSQQAISDYEAGETSPTVDVVEALARALDLSAVELMAKYERYHRGPLPKMQPAA